MKTGEEGGEKKRKREEIEAYSAGIEKHGINPYALQVMAEAGVDISDQQSQLLTELPIRTFDWVITLCGHADETCPFFPGQKIHVGFDDPPKLAKLAETEEDRLAPYRLVRDEIRDFIMTLPAALTDMEQEEQIKK